MKILIVTNGEIYNLGYLRGIAPRYNYIICVDGAARYLHEIYCIPDLMVGDMDSVNDKDLEWIRKHNIPVKEYDVKKDYTDTEIAIDAAINLKAEKITVLGGIGNRIDHSVSNIFLLKKIADSGILGEIIDEHFEIQYLDKNSELHWQIGETVSFIPLNEDPGIISLEGFEYPLVDKSVSQGTSLCVSNVVKKSIQKVKIKDATLLAIRNKQLSV